MVFFDSSVTMATNHDRQLQLLYIRWYYTKAIIQRSH